MEARKLYNFPNELSSNRGNDMNQGFVMLQRGKEIEDLMKDPNALAVITLIASRAKRTNEFSTNDLKLGEALIGDYRACGLTEKKYRGAKERLEKGGFVTFKGTNKGTIAKLLNTKIYDINIINCKTKGRTKDEKRADKRADKNTVIKPLNTKVYNMNSKSKGRTKGRTKDEKRATKNIKINNNYNARDALEREIFEKDEKQKTDSKLAKLHKEAQQVIKYLNKSAGSDYKSCSEIIDRLKEGITLGQCIKHIDNEMKHFNHADMNPYKLFLKEKLEIFKICQVQKKTTNIISEEDFLYSYFEHRLPGFFRGF